VHTIQPKWGLLIRPKVMLFGGESIADMTCGYHQSLLYHALFSAGFIEIHWHNSQTGNQTIHTVAQYKKQLNNAL
jgi:hypothetical protein